MTEQEVMSMLEIAESCPFNNLFDNEQVVKEYDYYNNKMFIVIFDAERSARIEIDETSKPIANAKWELI